MRIKNQRKSKVSLKILTFKNFPNWFELIGAKAEESFEIS